MMLVLLLGKNGLLATARSDKAPMLPPSLVRVAVPPAEPRITPAAGRPKVGPTLVRSACQPPVTDPPDGMLTVTLLPPVPLIPVLTALIAVLNCPVVDTLAALTCTGPVVEAAQMPCASAPCVEITSGAVTVIGPPGVSIGLFMIVLLLLRILPLSARMPNAPEPFVVIGPDKEESTVTLPLTERAAMPMPFPPSVVMPRPV